MGCVCGSVSKEMLQRMPMGVLQGAAGSGGTRCCRSAAPFWGPGFADACWRPLLSALLGGTVCGATYWRHGTGGMVPAGMVSPIGGTVSARFRAGARGGGCRQWPAGMVLRIRSTGRPAIAGRRERCLRNGASYRRHGVVPPIGGTVGCWAIARREVGDVAGPGGALRGRRGALWNRPADRLAGLRPATAGRRAIRRSSAGYHAGRGGRWTAGRTRPPPGFRRRHACTPGQWPRRKRCPPERCRALRRRERCLLVWCRLIRCRQLTARFFGGTVYGRAGHEPPPGIPGGGVLRGGYMVRLLKEPRGGRVFFRPAEWCRLLAARCLVPAKAGAGNGARLRPGTVSAGRWHPARLLPGRRRVKEGKGNTGREAE